jgi:hypothetical protein
MQLIFNVKVVGTKSNHWTLKVNNNEGGMTMIIKTTTTLTKSAIIIIIIRFIYHRTNNEIKT